MIIYSGGGRQGAFGGASYGAEIDVVYGFTLGPVGLVAGRVIGAITGNAFYRAAVQDPSRGFGAWFHFCHD